MLSYILRSDGQLTLKAKIVTTTNLSVAQQGEKQKYIHTSSSQIYLYRPIRYIIGPASDVGWGGQVEVQKG